MSLDYFNRFVPIVSALGDFYMGFGDIEVFCQDFDELGIGGTVDWLGFEFNDKLAIVIDDSGVWLVGFD